MAAPTQGTRSRFWRVAARTAPIVLSCLLVLSLHRQLPAAVACLRNARAVGLLSLVSFFLWNHVATLAWRALLRAAGVHTPDLRKLVRFRIEAQAVNQLVPTAGVGGEALRTVRVASQHELGAASLATLLDNVAGTITGLVFAVGALSLAALSRGGQHLVRALVTSGLCAIGLLVVSTLLPFRLAPRLDPVLSPANPLRKALVPFVQHGAALRRAFRDAIALRFVERLIAVSEIYVLFLAAGTHVSVGVASVVSAVFVMTSFAAFFVPGQLGAAEAAAAAASTLLGFPAALGLSVALLRRLRQLVVAAVGIVSLLLRKHERWKEPGTHRGRMASPGSRRRVEEST